MSGCIINIYNYGICVYIQVSKFFSYIIFYIKFFKKHKLNGTVVQLNATIIWKIVIRMKRKV